MAWRSETGPSSRIEFYQERGIVRKVYRSDIANEYDKACKLDSLSKPGSYAFAQPVSLNPDASAIDYCLISPCTTVYQVIQGLAAGRVSLPCAVAVMRLCGEALAAVHKGLVLASARTWEPPAAFIEALSRYGGDGEGRDIPPDFFAFGHGDFGFSNILVAPGRDDMPSIHVIDSSPNSYSCGSVLSYEPVYVDAGLFASALFGRVPLQYQRALRQWEEELLTGFLEPYEAAMSLRLDRRILTIYACASVRSYRRGNKPGRRVRTRQVALRGLEWRMARRLKQ